MLRRAVEVVVEARVEGGATAVTATLRATAFAGHAVPTGDIFRALALRVWPASAPGRAQTALFTRTWQSVTERTTSGLPVSLRRPRSDTRVPPPGENSAASVTLRIEGARGDVLRWRLDHLRMPAEMALRNGISDADNRTIITAGTVATCQRAVQSRAQRMFTP